ncbi:tRNA (adenosine(37)-N6)-dimethylallyltransferase MiaA [Sporosarcina thermotolerans]|uniref:tRNA dimethylallyltransferase n=1 Tax=Sporosarcina thermotolerans TaxID=633404 RepID=A0AAW9A676_9BACL|nr:tRNA (adenosine(37)-N6)-dimethylallyltransferase MiaA [Sporosarcina thermotolerans]MDW0115654.1 tRNA (adenosine(37)-N6)-dimethylallyltransferase MiaA [Sporosarcina thermotolerans]WHT47059.1 tRNA (adenosine(37)-N6)-dimethylallyltransferase MiaA [Sporosarcina thermotolerans]
MKNEIKVIAIVGPTASGKTALSIELAKMLDGEIINGDAMQVYKGLDIGTAKIKEEEKDGIPHHLFDVKGPSESFSVAEYQYAVRNCIDDILKRGKQPIIVGGTGLYIQSVLFDFRFTDEASDETVRTALEDELTTDGGPERLYNRLLTLDPNSAEKIHPNNHRRLIRALEIIEVTGKTKNEHEKGKGRVPVYDHVIIGMDMDREVLYDRINRRVDQMMEEGLLDEASALWNKGIRDVQSVQAIGYKEIHQYLEGKLSFDDAVALIKQNTRHYAKRQMTYFRNKMDIFWVDALLDTKKNVEGILIILKDFNRIESNK